MLNVIPEEWRPAGVDSLEPAAEDAVRSTAHTVVIAGPGAGKTELLAQRACYLLQTGICPRPKRILAISFKRDAARNLGERVLLRCGSELGSRFDSMTFDAFAKGLLDRFCAGLPIQWKPSVDYEIDFDLGKRRVRDWLQQAGLSYGELAGLSTDQVYDEFFLGRPLQIIPREPSADAERAAAMLWQYALHGRTPSVVNFQMIGRLAELMLRANPKILNALRATYRFVFLDEFQDTTAIQFELTKSAFFGSDAVLTAVGDNKQRIMGWANALEDSFSAFGTGFSANCIRLVNNYRAAPELVQVLGHLTAALDENAVPPQGVCDETTDAGECRLLMFRSHQSEATGLTELVNKWLTTEGLAPRDICILTRNRPANYTEVLRDALSNRGIEGRIGSELQDLLERRA